jgi:hypothetical protein
VVVAWRITSLVFAVAALALAAPAVARADGVGPAAPAQLAPEEALDKKIAVWRFDALGIDPEIVQRLETLFRMELDRLDRQPMPTARAIERATTERERDCTGEEKCLVEIGKRLGVDLVVTGTVGSLGDNYVLTIKAVEVATAKSRNIQTDPLRGSPDDLIEGVRVAAYKLLAPEQLHGAVQVQTDLVGAAVVLDGKELGKTPLPNQGLVGRLPLGKHRLRVAAGRYEPIEQDVEVHFQKVSPVLVHLLPSEATGTGATVRKERRPFYTKTWFIVAAGVGAIALGGLIGYEAGYIPLCTFDKGRKSCN